jgi:hypothetical protein
MVDVLSHLSSSFDETETESPKRLQKLVPQHLVAAALIQNWRHNIQLQQH